MQMNEIKSAIQKAKSILILPHVSADGDALGSSIGLGLALKKLGIEAEVLLEEDIPYIYQFLPGKEITAVYKGQRSSFDLVVALDTGDVERLGGRAELFKSAPLTINIDHHNTNTNFGGYNYVDTGASAVGEIIYQMICFMGIELDSDISTCLYVAITTDTGGFRFSNTTSITHTITSELLSKGVKVSEISQRVFDSTSIEKVKLTGHAINSLELYEDGKIAALIVSDEMMKNTGAKEEDCEGIVNIGRNIRGVEVAIMLRQRGNDEIKANLRSNEYVDVSAIAGLFSGGGHKRAAGFTSKGNMTEVKEKLLNAIRNAL